VSLVTRCPKCDSGFAVTADLLRLHDGLVRCGQCSHVFDGFECLQDSLPTLTQKVGEQSTPTPALESELEQEPAKVTVPVMPTASAAPEVFRMVAERRAPTTAAWASKPASSFQSSVTTEPTEPSLTTYPSAPVSGRSEPVFKSFTDETAEPEWSVPERAEPAVKIVGEARLRGDDPSAFGRTVPDFMEDEEPESPSRALIWLSGAVALSLVLLGQLLYVYRDDVASSVPTLRPLLEQVCRPLGCEVGYVRRIERIFVVGSSLQLATNQPVAGVHDYVLRLTLQNRFDRAQPWPSLMVVFSDASGTVVIRRALAPSEYLPPDLLARPFGAQQEASLEIPMRVTGSTVSGFEVEKFFP
jgi:predicted Zn finger-like uncharacterized protein